MIKGRGQLDKLLRIIRDHRNPKVKGIGPMKWCNTCSRYHRARQACNLFLRTRTAKSGREVQRWAH